MWSEWLSLRSPPQHILYPFKHKLWWIVSFFTLMQFISCTWSPERDNPADPGSIAYNGGTLLVSVYKLNGSPLEDAYVHISETGLQSQTNSTGTVSVSVPIGWIHVSIELHGYRLETDSIEINYRGNQNLAFHLNSMPKIENVQIVSGFVEGRLSRDFTHYYIVRASVYDADGFGTIEEVRYTDPFTGTFSSMQNHGNGFYADSLDLGVGSSGDDSLIASLERPVQVIVEDQPGDTALTMSALNQYFEYDRLRNDMITISVDADSPKFSWSVPELDFLPLRYLFELYYPDGERILMDSLIVVVPDTMSSDTLSVLMDEINVGITIGRWRLNLFDSSGNWVRSTLEDVNIDY
ncbi:MAG: hypothetical protein P9L92_07545 [Candidatus Electryonea clarkiae]|nr:hypothetical protein [Candidatus Electryonea clarkiae]MDP8286285.1 hypothetical protein [Candidatus Electryonea clarkiae]